MPDADVAACMTLRRGGRAAENTELTVADAVQIRHEDAVKIRYEDAVKIRLFNTLRGATSWSKARRGGLRRG